MPSKLQTTVEMVAYTAKDICSHPEVFTAFLETAANNYKYGFRDQMLIFAQKPNATACAEIEVWNKLGRYVNRGTKGIALLVDRNVPYRLRHVFDIADTNSFHGNEVKLWQMKPEYEEAVIEALENSFGEVDNKTGFADVLLGISELIVSDNFSDYCEKLKSVKHGSFLEEVDDLNTEVYFRGLLKNSVAYMLLTRCGYDAAEYLDAEDFRNICNFNTVDTLNIIGCANRDISEMVLREVAETVKSIERESKASNRTFEKPTEIKDNITENKTLEGSIENGTDLQERGRLPSPEHSGTGSSEDREIWDAAAHISAALPQDDAVGIAAERKTERAPRTDRPSGERDDGNSDERNGEIAGSERRTQSEQPNEVGSDDEQHQSVGGGNGTEGHRLQLSGHNYNGPSEVPYYHNEDEKAELLRNCIALKNHRKEIATFIAEHEDRKECGNFIKDFFDNTYVEHILDNGQRVGYRAYDDLLTIWKGSYLSRESDAFISWERVANKIYGLILTHEWLSPDEQPLPTVGEQFRLFEEASAEKANQFTLPQEAIDYVLRGAGNISQGRLSTYDQFLKQEGKEKNIAFLKNGYGIGGGSDAIPESGYWESHDGKGIKIYKGIGDEQKSVLLPWNKVEKRIGELIEADRYLTAADKEAYPKYKREKMLRNERYELMREFRSIYEDYNDFERQLGNESAVLSMFELGDCASQFMNGEKRCHFVSGNPFVLPTMRDALHKIIDAKTHLTERAEKMLEALSGDLAKPLEPSYDELNPPPEPEKEYRFSLGDTVHIGADEYSILSIDDKSVLLNDSKFPLLCEEMKREEFDRKIAENPMNDKYLQAVETVPENADGPIDNEKIRITLDSGRDAVHWIYYNPDSDAGGLYVSGDLAFSVFEELVEEYDIANHPENAEKFFSDLEEMSDQFLAEINTPFFLEAENDYESDYDYIEFTPENILSIHRDIAELSKTAAQESQTPVSASERESEVLESVLNKLNIGDIKLAFEDGELVATDGSNNAWRGKQFYDFLVEDAISYDEYGKPNEIDGDMLADFTELCRLHGVEIKDYNAPSPWDEYEKAKKENPDAVVMPKDLSAGEISVRLGAAWIPPEDIERFMFELFGTARYISFNIHVHYSEYSGEWNIEGKSYDRNNVKVYNAYGTNRINGYKIIEETLNLRDVRVFDYVEDENGNKKSVLNKNDTAVAQGKQQLIKDAFADWIWKDQERRDRLCKLYNEKFNSVRPREYNGEHLNFVGMNPEITLRPHQVNAIAHILYGGNTLLAHVVGAGKTFEMVAAAQESKRLGLCNKSLFVVPNHLTEQWAAEYLQLYPSANILVASKKDFETKNRKKFCGRIATGDYDAIIIGHSQFEKIPMSVERQQAILNQQLEEIMNGISELKRNRGENFSIKQLEKAKKTVKQKLEKLNDQTRKDDIVTFEELGVDRLFVDEAHYYKNLAAFTKMRNVGGISQTEAQKSSDLYMKCRYLDELTGGKGVVFATGTPISNSMVELYTMQKYLEYNLLRKNDLLHFDSWASTFGETVTAIELAPKGYTFIGR